MARRRGAIARLWLAEILVVACAGGALGLLFAHWLSVAIVALAPDDMPRLNDVSVDATVAFFTFAAVVAVALVTGAMPLRQAGAASLIEAFDGERTTSSRQALRTRSILLVAQIGLSVVLLVAAGLVVRSFMAVRQIDLGFTADRVLSLKVQPGNPNDLGKPLDPGLSVAGPCRSRRRGRRRGVSPPADARTDRRRGARPPRGATADAGGNRTPIPV